MQEKNLVGRKKMAFFYIFFVCVQKQDFSGKKFNLSESEFFDISWMQDLFQAKIHGFGLVFGRHNRPRTIKSPEANTKSPEVDP